jgi:hypothetical protein
MFRLCNVNQNQIAACAALSFVALMAQAQANAACDILRIEGNTGTTLYYGSAIPTTIGGKSVLITADHVLPLETRVGDAMTIVLSGQKSVYATIARRDWASDLMILIPQSPLNANCTLSSRSVDAGEAVSLVGYPASTRQKVTHDGRVLETSAPEVRVARPISMIKVSGIGEKGMSGGALLSRDGSVAGILLQDWVNPNHPDQSGVYALPANQIALQAIAMLAQSELEMPAPFKIRRAVPEMSAYGFRFRPAYSDSIADKQIRGSSSQIREVESGGHPDGIGGESSADELEVVGLSGDTISSAWTPMAAILRRIQSEGGSEMLVRQTASGQSCSNLVELGRLLFENLGSPPDLGFFLNRTSSPTASSSSEDLDALSERMVIVALSLAEASPAALEPAQKIRALQGEWIRTHEVRTIQELLSVAQAAAPAWQSAAEADSQNWKSVVELQVLILRINKALGQTTSSTPPGVR